MNFEKEEAALKKTASFFYVRQLYFNFYNRGYGQLPDQNYKNRVPIYPGNRKTFQFKKKQF